MKVYIGKFPKDSHVRKVDVRIDKQDLWGLYETLAHIIHPALVRLKGTKHGAPFVEDSDVPEELRRPIELFHDAHGTDDNWFKRWDWVLDEMIFAFDCHRKGDWEDQFHTGEVDLIFKPVDEEGNPVENDGAKWYELDFGPGDTHTFDREGFDAMQKRISNGTRLFGVYYESLWN
jgi:hypothetical protein